MMMTRRQVLKAAVLGAGTLAISTAIPQQVSAAYVWFGDFAHAERALRGNPLHPGQPVGPARAVTGDGDLVQDGEWGSFYYDARKELVLVSVPFTRG